MTKQSYKSATNVCLFVFPILSLIFICLSFAGRTDLRHFDSFYFANLNNYAISTNHLGIYLQNDFINGIGGLEHAAHSLLNPTTFFGSYFSHDYSPAFAGAANAVLIYLSALNLLSALKFSRVSKVSVAYFYALTTIAPTLFRWHIYYWLNPASSALHIFLLNFLASYFRIQNSTKRLSKSFRFIELFLSCVFISFSDPLYIPVVIPALAIGVFVGLIVNLQQQNYRALIRQIKYLSTIFVVLICLGFVTYLFSIWVFSVSSLMPELLKFTPVIKLTSLQSMSNLFFSSHIWRLLSIPLFFLLVVTLVRYLCLKPIHVNTKIRYGFILAVSTTLILGFLEGTLDREYFPTTQWTSSLFPIFLLMGFVDCWRSDFRYICNKFAKIRFFQLEKVFIILIVLFTITSSIITGRYFAIFTTSDLWPPKHSVITEFLESNLSPEKNKSFSGRVATIIADDKVKSYEDLRIFLSTKDSFDINDHELIAFSYFKIPSLSTHNSALSPFYFAFMSKTLSTDITQVRSRVVINKINAKILAMIGVRYVVTNENNDASEIRSLLKDPHYPELVLSEVPNANLSGYTPIKVEEIQDFDTTVNRISQKSFDPKLSVLVSPGLVFEKLVQAENLSLEFSGRDLLFSGTSTGTSLVVLPIEFSNCLTAQNLSPDQDEVRLIRSNGLLTGVLFSKSASIKLRFHMGALNNSDCRLRDLTNWYEMQTSSNYSLLSKISNILIKLPK